MSPLTAGNAQPVNLLQALNLSGLVLAALILVATWFAVRLAAGLLEGLGERFVSKRPILLQVATVTRFALWLSASLAAVAASVRLSNEVLLALAGTAAVTIGFALKDLAASVMAGLIIIFDRPFQVGDRVQFEGVYGEIAAIGLRSTRLVTLDDNVITIPNNKFLTEKVASANAGALAMLIQMDFFIGVDQDLETARRLVEECLTSNRYVYLKKPWAVLINQVFHESYVALRLRAKAYVLDAKYETEFQTDVTERVVEAFRARDILPPAVLHRALGGAVPVAGSPSD